MRVTIEDVPQVKLGNKGILIRIRDDRGGKIVGKLWISQANIRWAKGSTQEKNAKTISMSEFVDYLNSIT
jgi:hypothetical protein